ncbi:septum site-determining protein Ssd [Cumulibacter manganitolerans]|uniref:septum site-determining protein Ssd n=1 Tax=Cumulibacter manganitolerans TaxID=1884992 RepID=UPI001297B16A|nr:septum site-determining protein Ssd [Cumulibacter manganitolerans]
MTEVPEQSVLLITGDRALAQRAERIAAAARHRVVRADPRVASGAWASADVVLIGADRLGEVVDVDPPRRDEVYVIAGSTVPDSAWRDCVSIGATDAVALDESEGWLVERLSLRRAVRASGRVVAVRGAAGGVGTSVVAAGLALAVAGAPAVLIDTDPAGGWLDLILGIDLDGLGWAELAGLRGRVDGAALAASVPGRDGLSLLTADRDAPPVTLRSDALRAAVLAGSGLGGTVVVDDRQAVDLAPTVTRLADVLVVVTTSDLRGGLAGRRAVDLALDGRASGVGSAPAVLVAARTPRRGALETATFTELVEGADDVLWVRELAALDRRVGRGRPGLRPRDKLVADCRRLLELCATHAGWSS